MCLAVGYDGSNASLCRYTKQITTMLWNCILHFTINLETLCNPTYLSATLQSVIPCSGEKEKLVRTWETNLLKLAYNHCCVTSVRHLFDGGGCWVWEIWILIWCISVGSHQDNLLPTCCWNDNSFSVLLAAHYFPLFLTFYAIHNKLQNTIHTMHVQKQKILFLSLKKSPIMCYAQVIYMWFIG